MATHRPDVSLLSKAQFQEITGFSLQTIRKRIAESGIESVKQDGRSKLYRAREVLNALYGKQNPYEEKCRLDKLRADEVEHRLSLAKNEVAPIAILEDALSNIAGQINSALDALPLRIKKGTPKLSARNVEDIRRTIVKLQNEMSETKLDYKT